MTTRLQLRLATSPLPATLADVALVDAATCAAAGAMSVSWWHEEVRACRAPAPVVRMPRCTRWRVVEVAAFWKEFAARAAGDPHSAALLTARAKKASLEARKPEAVAKAKAKRVAKAAAIGLNIPGDGTSRTSADQHG